MKTKYRKMKKPVTLEPLEYKPMVRETQTSPLTIFLEEKRSTLKQMVKERWLIFKSRPKLYPVKGHEPDLYPSTELSELDNMLQLK